MQPLRGKSELQRFIPVQQFAALQQNGAIDVQVLRTIRDFGMDPGMEDIWRLDN